MLVRWTALVTAAATMAALLALSAPASALPPLGENAYVTDRLVAARVEDKIRKACPTISARVL